MKTKWMTAVCALLAMTFQVSAFEATDQASLDAADQWLKIVDEGDYSKSWQAGALTFKLTVTQDLWVQLMQAIRQPLGNVTERKAIEQRPAYDPQGLPEGDYMVIFYKSRFQNKNEAHELVTLVHEGDGVWRVLTYQVQ